MSDITAARLLGDVSISGIDKARAGLVGLSKDVDKTQAGLTGLEKTVRGTGRNVDTFGQSMKSASAKLNDIGGKLTRNVSLPLVGIGFAIGKVGSGFDAQMSKVEAKSGATGRELAKLRAQALELGSSTAFSAREAAQGMEELAAAGLKPREVLAAMPGLLDAAAASGESVASVSSIVANSLAQFSLEAGESTRIADVLAKASNETQGSISSMGEALKYAGTGASQMGLDIEQTTALLSKMVKAGIDGGQAGTALRMGLLKLATVPPMRALDKIDDISPKLAAIWKSATPVPEKLRLMSAEMEKLDGQSRAAAAGIIFGSEASTGMIEALKGGPASIDKWTASMRNAGGEAKRMGESMRNNLRGDIEQLGGAIETLFITIFDANNGPLRSIAQGLTSMVNAFSDADPAIQQLAVVFGVVAAAAGPLLLAAAGVAAGLSGIAAIAAVVSAPVVAIGAAGIAAGVGLAILYSKSESVRIAVSGLWEAFKVMPHMLVLRGINAIVQATGGWGDAFRRMGIVSLSFGVVVAQMALGVTRAINNLTGNWLSKFASILQAVAFVKPEFRAAADAVGAMADRSRSSSSRMEQALTRDIAAMRQQIVELKRDINSIPSYKSVTVEMRRKSSGTDTGPTPTGASAAYSTGGRVIGPGTATSDSIPARLSDGEYVVQAKSVQRYGVKFMDALNAGQVQKFATGGMAKKRRSFNPADVNKDGKTTKAELNAYTVRVAAGDVSGARFNASNDAPDVAAKRATAAAALEATIKAQNAATSARPKAIAEVKSTAKAFDALQAQYSAIFGPGSDAKRRKLKPRVDAAKKAAAAAKARLEKINATISGSAGRRQELANQIVGYDQSIASIGEMSERNAEQQARDDENLRREALGLESLEEEERRNKINAIRRANGLADIPAGGTESEDQNLAAQLEQQRQRTQIAQTEAKIATQSLAAFTSTGDIGYGGGSTAFGSARGAQPVNVIVQSMTGYSPEIQNTVAYAAAGGFSQGANAYRLYTGRG